MKLSIITININNLAGLQKTIGSVFAQTFTDYEYLIIDGGSTDGSKEYIKQYEYKFSYWVSERDEGIFNAMNKGIVKSTGEYLLFMNSGDCLFCAETLSLIFENIENEDIIYGNAMVERGMGDKNEILTYPDNLTFKFFRTRALHHNSSIIKAKLFEKLGLYNEDFKVMSDWEFFTKAICLNQASYKHVNQIVCCFNPDGISSQIESGQLKLDERQIVLEKYFYAVFPELIDLEMENKRIKSMLNLYQISRFHKIVEKVINHPVYKYLKRH